MDDGDRARKYQERLNTEALATHSSRVHEAPLIIGGDRVCKDCEGVIPFARLRLDPTIVRCIECQEIHEKRQKTEGNNGY